MKMLIYSKDSEGNSFMNEIVNVSGIKYFPDMKMPYKRIKHHDGYIHRLHYGDKEQGDRRFQYALRKLISLPDFYPLSRTKLSGDYCFYQKVSHLLVKS